MSSSAPSGMDSSLLARCGNAPRGSPGVPSFGTTLHSASGHGLGLVHVNERHKTPIGEMWLEDGILFHRVDTSDTITEDDARAVVTLVSEITGGRPTPSVVDIRSIGFASMGARRGFAGSPDSSNETATALVVSSSSSRVMAQAFLKLARPERPIGVFTDVAKAREWAEQHRPEA